MSETDVERVKRKMSGKVMPPPPPKEELPSMEPSTKTDAEKSEEADRLRNKAGDGAVAVVNKVMKQPEVQNIIKKNVNKQTFISGLFMAFLLIGFLQVSQAVKQIFNYTWQFDLSAGVIMIAIGAVYMIKEVVLVKEAPKTNNT